MLFKSSLDRLDVEQIRVVPPNFVVVLGLFFVSDLWRPSFLPVRYVLDALVTGVLV